MADYSYRNPRQTAFDALEALGTTWPELAEPTEAAIRPVLAGFTKDLNAAQGDFARGTVLVEFLPQLEAVSGLPAPVLGILQDAHRPLTRKLESLSDTDGRKLVALINAIEGSGVPQQASEPTAKTPSPATGEPVVGVASQRFDEAGAKTRRVVEQINREFEQLSLDAQLDVARLMRELWERLRAAENDQQREEAAQWFLSTIAEHPVVGDMVASILVKRGARDVTALSEPAAQLILERIEGNPRVISPISMAVSDDDVDLPSFQPSPGPVTTDAKGVTATGIEVELHTKVDFPAEVSIFEEVVPLVVQLTIEKPEVSVAHGTGTFEFADVEEPEQVVVVVAAEGFEEVTGEVSRIIEIYADRDSQPAVFLFKPLDVGRQRISISFYHRERLACAVSFEAEIKDRPPVARETRAGLAPLISEGGDGADSAVIAVPFSRSSKDSMPPDLELRIITGAQKTRLTFLLRSSSGRYAPRRWSPMGTIELTEEPRRYVEGLQAELNRMARKRSDQLSKDEASTQRRRMAGMGQNLYLRLFPWQLKQAYRAISEKMHNEQEEHPDRGKPSLLISSDEPWIPWEIVKPHELEEGTGRVVVDDDFLCREFIVTRWLAGRGVAEAVPVHVARLIAPQSNLESVQRERQYFEQELAGHTVEFLAPVIETTDDVVRALQDAGASLYHFACHGEYFDQNPDESVLLLRNDEPFAPSDVIGSVRAGVAQSKPLVFLNACHSGESGFALTGLGGWAERFVNAGASAFVGTLWQVNDSLAAEFAIKFYDLLWHGENLGNAFYGARLHIHGLDDANPTWLAYTLYADPNGRVELASA